MPLVHSNLGPSPKLGQHIDQDARAPPSSAASLASIFRLAARIISSLLRCSNVCLSSLLVLHPFLSAEAPSSAGDTPSTLSLRLYRVIRSGWAGCSGFFACVPVALGALLAPNPSGGGGWNVTGG
jgi:hypothetical protein